MIIYTNRLMKEVAEVIPNIENDPFSYFSMICYDATKNEIELFNKLVLIAKIRTYTKDSLPFERNDIEYKIKMILNQMKSANGMI